MNSQTSELISAVLSGDAEKVRKCLSDGASPNVVNGHSLIIHAALSHHPLIFKLLLEHGANLPEDFLYHVIIWKLDDYIIRTQKHEDELIEILDMVRSTKAWPSLSKRQELAARLEADNLTDLIAVMLREEPHEPAQ